MNNIDTLNINNAEIDIKVFAAIDSTTLSKDALQELFSAKTRIKGYNNLTIRNLHYTYREHHNLITYKVLDAKQKEVLLLIKDNNIFHKDTVYDDILVSFKYLWMCTTLVNKVKYIFTKNKDFLGNK